MRNTSRNQYQRVPRNQLSAHYLGALNRTKTPQRQTPRSVGKRDSKAFEGSQSHHSWIEQLLTQYYDPMYQYQLTKKEKRIEFVGSPHAVTEYLRNKT